eukprot:4466216-Amphidinium_carterae.1
MRLSYLAQDRVDVQFASKEIARQMSNPCVSGWEALKRAVRYLLGTRRVALRFPRQETVKFIDSYSDSNFAGCLKTRRSTSATAL